MDGAGEWNADLGIEVLFIAEDSAVAEVYKLKLQMDGYRVTAVRRLRDWRTHRPGWKPDIVLIDVDDRDGTGIRDVERLRSEPKLKNVPLLVLSSQPSEVLHARGLTLRPTDYRLPVMVHGQLTQAVDQWGRESLELLPY